MRYEALILRDAKYSNSLQLQVSCEEWLTFAKDSLDNGFYTIASKVIRFSCKRPASFFIHGHAACWHTVACVTCAYLFTEDLRDVSKPSVH
jgi:hypothetical protein